ncbi:MAG: tRNA 2-selenouridine(34) synthase MnmH [Betaproteobacteria bacterium]|nr:tRNA 2-selenouridine(34) synthase MnmH [Betaproteobacteria bacterium]
MRPAVKTSVAMQPGILRRFDNVLDARTLEEYVEDHIPGAVSTPVLDEQERARVGTIYKQQSPFDAKRIGAALVARNIARHLETLFATQPKTWKPLVYCWRGGKRSGALAHILREVGWGAVTLEGGYKAYRRHAVQRLAELPGTLQFRVLHGATGSGKSRLLRELRACGAQVLDLEELAAHRGSVLGGLPERPQPAQKMFESLVLHELEAMNAAKPVFVEAESRKIGQRQVPEGLIGAMRAAECVTIDASLATRVELLMDEYRHFFDDPPTLDAQLDCLVALHGKEKIEDWKALARSARWSDLVGRLLEEHYDPAYRRSASKNFSGLERAEVLRLPGADATAFARLARELAT